MGGALVLVLPFGVAAAAGHGHGSLDPSFGSRGVVKTAFGSDAFAHALAIQRDGKLVAAGDGTKGLTTVFALARYGRDGSLDRSFGVGGKVLTQIGAGDAVANGLAIQSDGKVVAAGYSNPSFTTKTAFTLVRYHADGSLDSSFGSDGKVVTPIGDVAAAFALVVQPDGKLVAAGFSANSGPGVFALVRYMPDGSLDPGFGSGGVVATAVGSGTVTSVATANFGLVVQRDGKLVVAGEATSRGRREFALVRYRPDGSLDRSFGVGGKVLTPIGSDGAFANALVIQPDGKLVAAGSGVDFLLARYKPNGALDASFGSGGIVTTPIGDDAEAYGLVIQPDGRLVAAGTSLDDATSALVFALARYKPNGRLDHTFWPRRQGNDADRPGREWGVRACTPARRQPGRCGLPGHHTRQRVHARPLQKVTAASPNRPCPCSLAQVRVRSRSRGGAARLACTSWTAIAPSPTAVAHRFVEPERTSPAANTPGRLVSRR